MPTEILFTPTQLLSDMKYDVGNQNLWKKPKSRHLNFKKTFCFFHRVVQRNNVKFKKNVMKYNDQRNRMCLIRLVFDFLLVKENQTAYRHRGREFNRNGCLLRDLVTAM